MSNLDFFRANQRPDVVVTGRFSPPRRTLADRLLRRPAPEPDTWGDTWNAFMGIERDGVVVLPEGVDVHMLTPNEARQSRPIWDYGITWGHRTTATPSCRYCRVPRTRARTTCENCGAPYPAVTV